MGLVFYFCFGALCGVKNFNLWYKENISKRFKPGYKLTCVPDVVNKVSLEDCPIYVFVAIFLLELLQ